MPRVLESRPEFLNHIMTSTSQELAPSTSYLLPELRALTQTADTPVVLKEKRTIPYKLYLPKDTVNSDSPTFVCVYNVKKFFSESCATARITPEQYLKAQELGLTQHHDEALTAKVIGSLGQYRMKALRAQEELGIRTTLFLEKEALCGDAIKRLRFLQIIEREHGASVSQLKEAIARYKTDIEEEIQRLGEGKEDLLIKARVDALTADRAQADYLSSTLGSAVEGDQRGTDTTRDRVAYFVKERINHILASARNANELLTLSGAEAVSLRDKKGAFFRGSLHVAISEAFQINRDYIWDQKRAITPGHQGDYRSGAPYLTIYSTQLLGKGKHALQNFLFAMNLIVLNPSYDPYSAKSTAGVKTYSNRSQNSWVFRLFGRKRRVNEVNSYRKMIKEAVEASRNIFIDVLDDSISTLQSFRSLIVRNFLAGALNFVALFQVVIFDFWWTKKEEAHPAVAGAGVLQEHEEVVHHQLNLFTWRHLTLSQQISETFVEKLDISHKELHGEHEEAYLKNIRDIAEKVTAVAPIAQVPYHLRPYSPADAISQLVGGVEGFYGFFSAYYETCPSIALYASAVYLLSAAAILNPGLIGQISESLKFINTWSTVTAEAMSKSQHSQVIAAAFSGFKETLLSLQLATDGTDSTLSHAFEYLKSHLPQVIIGGAALAATGYELSALGDKVPYMGSEGGNVPGLEQSFVAAKVGVVAYESLHSEFGQQSLVARTITILLSIPFLMLRIALIPVNLLHKGIGELFKKPGYVPPSFEQVFKPVALDLPRGLVSIILRLVDVILRLSNLMLMASKVLFKAITDMLTNNLATVANHFQLAIGGAVGVAVAMFLLPYLGVASLGLFPIIGVGLAGALVTQVIFSSFGLNIKLPMISQLLLNAKHALFGFFDYRFTRPIKGFYESSRNQIGRVLTSEWMTGEKDIATYNFQRDGGQRPPVEPVSSVVSVPNPMRAAAGDRLVELDSVSVSLEGQPWGTHVSPARVRRMSEVVSDSKMPSPLRRASLKAEHRAEDSARIVGNPLQLLVISKTPSPLRRSSSKPEHRTGGSVRIFGNPLQVRVKPRPASTSNAVGTVPGMVPV